MPTKQELKKFIDDLKTGIPFLVAGYSGEYAMGMWTTLKVIEDEFGLNDTGVNLEG